MTQVSRRVACGVSIDMTFTPVKRISPTQIAFGMDEFCRRWPQCIDALQPASDAPPGNTYVPAWRRDFRNFAIRNQAATAYGLVGPFQGRGDCLDPYFRDGDLAWVDPSEQPLHGDFVGVQWSESFFHTLSMSAAADDYRRAWGRYPSGLAMKRLLRVGSEWVLATVGKRGTTAVVPAAGNARVLGVVRYFERGGVRHCALPSSMIRLDRVYDSKQVAPNAATEIYTAHDDGPDTFNPSTGGDGYLSLSGDPIDSASVLNGSLVIDAKVVDPVFTLAGIGLRVSWSGGSESTSSVQPQHTDTRSYSFQHSFTTLPPGVPWTMAVAMSGNASCTVQRASLRAEVIKR